MYVSINKDTWSHPHQLAEMFRKLHRQFGHASKAKLARTIKAAYPEVDHALLDQVTEGPFSGAPPDGGRQETTSFLSTLL